MCANAFNVTSTYCRRIRVDLSEWSPLRPPRPTANNIVCPFQPVQQSQVECGFDFPSSGVWEIKSQYSIDTVSGVSSVSVTSLRVTNS